MFCLVHTSTDWYVSENVESKMCIEREYSTFTLSKNSYVYNNLYVLGRFMCGLNKLGGLDQGSIQVAIDYTPD